MNDVRWSIRSNFHKLQLRRENSHAKWMKTSRIQDCKFKGKIPMPFPASFDQFHFVCDGKLNTLKIHWLEISVVYVLQLFQIIPLRFPECTRTRTSEKKKKNIRELFPNHWMWIKRRKCSVHKTKEPTNNWAKKSVCTWEQWRRF